MTGLFLVVVAAGAASLALAIVGRRQAGRLAPVLDCVMLAAMVDVHLPALGVLSAPLWSLLLLGCAITSAFTGRMRANGHSAAGVAHLHSAGMLLAALLVLLVGATAPDATVSVEPLASGTAHAHGADSSSPLIVVVAVAAIAYSVAAIRAVLLRPGRVEAARCLTSLVGIVAMTAMVMAPVVAPVAALAVSS